MAGAHALVIALLVSETQIFQIREGTAVPLTAYLLSPRHRYRLRFRPPPLGKIAVRVKPITAPITLALHAIEAPIPAASIIDWTRAARAAVHAVLKHRKTVSFGFPAAARGFRRLHSPSELPGPGDSYRTQTGRTVHWFSHNCYVASNPPPIDASQLVLQAQTSVVSCRGKGSSAGPPQDNLFRNLPAYKRYQKLRAHRHRHAAAVPNGGGG